MPDSQRRTWLFGLIGAGGVFAVTLGLSLAPLASATASPSTPPAEAATASGSAASHGAASQSGASPSTAPQGAAPGDPTVMEDHPVEDFADAAAGLPAGLDEALRRDLGTDPATYLAGAAAAADAVDVLAFLDSDGVDIDGSRLSGTTLVVNVASQEDADAVARAGATAEYGAPAPLDISGIDFVPAFDVDGGDGYAWTSTDGTSRQCSIGFSGRRVSDGRAVAVTAGHCVGGMTTISGPVRQLVQTAPGNGGSFGQPIGTPGATRFGGGFDGGLITLDAAGVTSRGSVLTWGGGTGSSRSSAAIPVTRVSAAIVGANLCKSGSRTGWTCGVVRAVDQSVNVGGSTVNSILATTCLQPGDSGGPALIGGTAVGINSSTSSAGCGTANYISAFFPMVSTAGAASIESQFGGAWEPSITLSAPAISSMTVPADGTPGALTGTVTSASPQTSVAVFVDGAGTPALTVPAASGAWTLDLTRLAASGVASGTHRITVVTQRGAWSRSAGTDATIGFGGSPSRVTEALIPPVFVQR